MRLTRGIRVLAVFAALLAAQAAAAEEFVWRIGPRIIGRLKVPAGFRLELYSYREGILTTLRYPSGAHIVLRCGGMYRIPMFQNGEHVLNSSTESDRKTVRRGQFAVSGLLWREDNYEAAHRDGSSAGVPQVFPPNLAYANVPPGQRAELDSALDSFERESERPARTSR